MRAKIYLLNILLALFFTSLSAQNSFDVEVQGEKVVLPENINSVSLDQFPDEAKHSSGYYGWVQFFSTPTQDIQDYFSKSGVELIEYISNKTYLAFIPANTNIANLKTKNVRSIIPVPWETKVHIDVKNGDTPHYAKKDGNIRVTVIHHNTANTAEVISNLISDKIIVDQVYKGATILELTISNDCLEALAKKPFIKWIEFIAPPSVKEDTRGKSIHRSNSLDTQSVSGNNYTGDGIGVLVRDDGIVGPHIDFQGRIDNSNASGSGPTHGDGVAGILAGAGNLDPTKRGMAAGSTVYVSNYASSFLDTATTSLINNGDVQITNSSYGDGCNGGYTSRSNTVDTQANNNLSLLHVFSAGNSGTSDCGYGAGAGWGNITGGHKQGKNVIATANVFYQGTLAGSSSKGPAYDGRIKPDITAHGQGQQSTNENNAYLSFGGTSGAAPGIAGVSAQLYELYAENNGGTLPQAALVKATLLNTANDYGNVGPDFNYGWGLVNGRRAGMLLENNNYLSSTISQSGSNNHTIAIPSGTAQVKIMLYWNDPAAAAGASTALINDLDLTVVDPANNTLLPYILDPTPNAANLSAPATNGVDRLNNMEQIVIDSPAAGNYAVDIAGFDVPMGPQEYFVVYDIIQEQLTLTYPNGEEHFVPGETETIHWDAVNTTADFLLEYSVDNGNSWSTIATVDADATNTDWSVPSEVTGSALIRITSGSFQDTSDAVYSIAQQPTNFQFSQVCPTQVNFTWSPVTDAEQYDIYLLGAEEMEVVATVNSNFASVTVPNGEASIWAAVVAKNNTLGWESRRTFAINNTGLVNCDSNNDLAIEITNDASDFSTACSATNDVTVSIRVSNFGLQDQNNFTYSYQLDSGAVIQETYNQTLSSGSVVDIDFQTPLTISSDGDYVLNANVTLAGDENPNNDDDTLSFYALTQATALDASEDFETNGFPALGWQIENPDNSTTWVENTVTGSSGTATTVASINNASYNAQGQLDIFYTQFYDLNGTTPAELYFDIAKAQWSASFNDAFRVDVSIDCGQTFTNIYDKDGLDLATVGYVGSSWEPASSADWREEVVDLSSYQNQIVQLRFINVNGYSNNTYIDNIRIEATDAINTPPTAASFTAQNGPYEGLVYVFNTDDFGYFDADNDPMDSLIIEEIPAEGSLYVDSNGNDMLEASEVLENGDVVTIADLTNENLQYIQNGEVNTSFQFEVSDGTANSSGDYVATLNIVPRPTVVLSQSPLQQNESVTSASIITATLSGTFGADVTISLSFSGDATANTDYTVSTNTITISSGATTGTIEVNNIDDDAFEPDETVITSISSVTYGDEDGVQEVTYTILNDDTDSITAVCQDITVYLDDAGSITIQPEDIDNGSSAPSGIASMSLDTSTFVCSDVGSVQVVLTVTDTNGMSDTCTATVTVVDDVAPTVICQNIIVVLDANGQASITASQIDNGSSDACGIDSISLDTTQFSCGDVGDNTVQLTVTDVNGNTETCDAIVTVEDNILPTVICQNITVELDENGNASITPQDIDNGSSDICGIGTLTLDIDQFTCDNIGDNSVILTVSDANGNTDSCMAIVTVEDNIDMTVNGPGDFSVETTNTDTGCETVVTYDPITGSDNCGEDQITVVQTAGLGSGELFPVGVTTETYEVTDANGGVTIYSFDVEVTDGTDPVMSGGCPDDTTETVEQGESYVIPDYSTTITYSDNCDVAPVFSQIPAVGTLVQPGTSTSVMLTVTDADGNESTCSFNLTVDETLGTASSQLSEATLLYPNPAKEVITIQYSGVDQIQSIVLYDVTGKRVKEIDVFSQLQTISVKSLAPGAYFVQIRTENAQAIKKIIKR